jgi:hypothetical protein
MKRLTPWQKVKFLWHVWRAWCRVPNQRFGQMIVNAFGPDPFYVEDGDAEHRIQGYPAHSAAMRKRPDRA